MRLCESAKRYFFDLHDQLLDYSAVAESGNGNEAA